jgi:transposase-like protein
VRLEGRIHDCAVLIAVGIEASGKRRVLGCEVATSEAEINGRRFLESLLARGLKGVKLIVADDHAGLKAARRALLPSVPWQRCPFPLQQNAGQLLTRQEAKKTVARRLRTLFNAPARGPRPSDCYGRHLRNGARRIPSSPCGPRKRSRKV